MNKSWNKIASCILVAEYIYISLALSEQQQISGILVVYLNTQF